MQTLFNVASLAARRLAILSTALVMTACATVQHDAEPGPGSSIHPSAQISSVANSKSVELLPQHIRGTLLDIDGKTPVAGATVYIANTQASLPSKHMLRSLSLSSSLNTHAACKRPAVPYTAYTCTHLDGSFDLAVDQVRQLPFPIILSNDKYKVSVSLDINDLGTNIGEVAFAVPEKEKQKIAIVLDFFNPYEDIKHQLKTGRYDMREAFQNISDQMVRKFDLKKYKSKVMFPRFASLFEDWDGDHQIDLFKYDIIYINSRTSQAIARLSKEKKDALLKFISRGGQIYITEWKFELPEIPLDQYI